MNLNSNIVRGKLLVNEFGNAFVNTDCGKTIYIKKSNINNAFHLEDVEVEYWNENDLYYGLVINFSLVGKKFVGTVSHFYMNNVFIQTSELGKKKICIENVDTNLYKGQWVSVEIKEVRDETIIGELICCLKDDVDNILNEKYNLSRIDHYNDNFNMPSKTYNDYTHHDVFTIDPPGCVDCDDAFSINYDGLTWKNTGLISVYVHISDVSLYINPDSPQFEEVIKRGNTFYGENTNWPMIPSELANKTCSILPNKLTYVVTVHFVYDTLKNTLEYKEYFYSVIQSRNKYTYEEIDALLTTTNGENDFLRCHPAQTLDKISKMCLESEFNDIVVTNETAAHRFVRYWMIKTNQAMCECIKGVYRVNPPPKEFKFDLFKKYIEPHDRELVLDGDDNARQMMVKYIKENSPLSPILEYIVKKTLVKAVYTDTNEYHYGLGINGYTHFTSPIRRSCDLINMCILRGYKFTKEKMVEYLGYMNVAEAKQDNIEEFMCKYKKYMLYKDNNMYENIFRDAIITDVTPNGIQVFVKELNDTYYIHISRLSYNKLNYDQNCKVLHNSYVLYQLFDPLLVCIKKIDFDNIELDLVQ